MKTGDSGIRVIFPESEVIELKRDDDKGLKAINS